MKKILSLLLCFYIPICNTALVFGLTKEEEKLGYDQYKTGDYSYSSNVSNLCLGQRYGGNYWNFDTSKQLIIQHNKDIYPDLSKTGGSLSFEDINKRYLETQDNIMNCAILKSKYVLHKKLIEEYKISERAKGVLKQANTIIEGQIEEQKCIPPRDGDKIYPAKDLLDSLSYEQCVYSMYLFYYKKACEKNLNICFSGSKPLKAIEIAETLNMEKSRIDLEHITSNKTLDSALSLYENFERTYIAHTLLRLIEIELIEDKRLIGVTLKAIQQWVSLSKNAQKTPEAR